MEFSFDMLILDLGVGYDIYLGISWLVIIGDIRWNFRHLKMEFMMGKRKMSLRGSQPTKTQLLDNKYIHKLIQKPTQLTMMTVSVMTVNQPKEKHTPSII